MIIRVLNYGVIETINMIHLDVIPDFAAIVIRESFLYYMIIDWLQK